jgi:hypothetical protein
VDRRFLARDSPFIRVEAIAFRVQAMIKADLALKFVRVMKLSCDRQSMDGCTRILSVLINGQ